MYFSYFLVGFGFGFGFGFLLNFDVSRQKWL